MKELLSLGWNAALLRHDAFVDHVNRDDVLKRGLALLVLVTLAAALISTLISFVQGLMPPAAPPRNASELLEQMRSAMGPMADYVQIPPEALDALDQFVLPQLQIAYEVQRLPTPLPRPIAVLLQKLGAWVSTPFARTGGWLAYGIWVMLFAKLLGGQAKVRQMLGATALFAVPHIMDILGFVPCLGPLLSLAATIWGIIIYVKAVSVASGFGSGKAILAALLPAIAMVVLMAIGLIPLILSLGAVAAQG
jgi:hypothetical protein